MNKTLKNRDIAMCRISYTIDLQNNSLREIEDAVRQYAHLLKDDILMKRIVKTVTDIGVQLTLQTKGRQNMASLYFIYYNHKWDRLLDVQLFADPDNLWTVICPYRRVNLFLESLQNKLKLSLTEFKMRLVTCHPRLQQPIAATKTTDYDYAYHYYCKLSDDYSYDITEKHIQLALEKVGHMVYGLDNE